MREGTQLMKILPSDDLSHKPDYDKNWRKYTQENTVEPQSKPGLLNRVRQLLGLKSGNN